MPLHPINRKPLPAVAPATYASELAQRSLPKGRMPETGVSAEAAHALVADELMLDGNSRQNLATFCQTWEEPRGPAADGPRSTRT